MIATQLCKADGLQGIKSALHAVNFWAASETPWKVRFHRL